MPISWCLPFPDIQTAAEGRVATATLEHIFPNVGAALMAAAIMISTFGCNNGLILAGARAYYAMARDGLFFRKVGELNRAKVPGWGLILQGVWACLLVLPRTGKRSGEAGQSLQRSARLRDLRGVAVLHSHHCRSLSSAIYAAGLRSGRIAPFGYPVVPALYIVGATVLVVVLLVYRPMTTWPGFAIVLVGVPIYFLWVLVLRQR